MNNKLEEVIEIVSPSMSWVLTLQLELEESLKEESLQVPLREFIGPEAFEQLMAYREMQFISFYELCESITGKYATCEEEQYEIFDMIEVAYYYINEIVLGYERLEKNVKLLLAGHEDLIAQALRLIRNSMMNALEK